MSEWVLDTSAIVAGILARRGAAARVVDAVFTGALKPVYTPSIIAEYAHVLARPELRITEQERWALLLKVRSSGILVAAVPFTLHLPDDDDRPFIEAALATTDKVFVTLNERHFAPARSVGISVITPRDAALRL